MTLPLRKKHRITALNLARASRTRRNRGGAFIAFVASLSIGLGAEMTAAQQPAWRPNRVEQATAPITNDSHIHSDGWQNANSQNRVVAQQSQEAENLGAGVVLRWKPSKRSQVGNSSDVAASQAFEDTSHRAAYQDFREVNSEPSATNPLRGARSNNQVQTVAYQNEQPAFPDPFGDENAQSNNAAKNPESLEPPPLPERSLEPPTLPGMNDPLSQPELPPQPGSILEQSTPFNNPFGDRQSPSDNNGTSGSAGNNGQSSNENSAEDRSAKDRRQLDLSKKRAETNTLSSCEQSRDRVKAMPLSKLDLNVSPEFGEGLRSAKNSKSTDRLDFASSAEVREWTNYKGEVIATGRMINLRNDQVVLDVNGSQRVVSFYDLSDIDVAYVGESWNIPAKCGTGYEPAEGRNFVCSTVQWKASGLCHKPLYFEQVQLERYGHEAGPIVQPLVSSAHFFTTIPVLPYKMGIHPPNECQYSLGYFRPGNCAPYMIQPIPWSLRGAVVEAAAVTGAAALIP